MKRKLKSIVCTGWMDAYDRKQMRLKTDRVEFLN